MEIKFEGKIALVTGAGKGIGKNIAIKLAECGAEVIAISRTQSDLDDLSSLGYNIRPICLDVGDWNKTQAVLEELGPVDLLVNNAGIAAPQLIGEIKEDFINSLFAVNFNAVVNISQEVINGMKRRGKGGAIVNISSISGLKGVPNHGIYGATKAALDQLTRNMAVEFGPFGIRVNSVNPCVVHTRMTENFLNPGNPVATLMKEKLPLGRYNEVEDISYPVLFLLSDKASMINGVTIPIDGGLSITI